MRRWALWAAVGVQAIVLAIWATRRLPGPSWLLALVSGGVWAVSLGADRLVALGRDEPDGES